MKQCHLQQTWWMDLENLMQHEMGQRELRTVQFHSYVVYKTEAGDHKQQCGDCQRGGMGERDLNIW